MCDHVSDGIREEFVNYNDVECGQLASQTVVPTLQQIIGNLTSAAATEVDPSAPPLVHNTIAGIASTQTFTNKTITNPSDFFI